MITKNASAVLRKIAKQFSAEQIAAEIDRMKEKEHPNANTTDQFERSSLMLKVLASIVARTNLTKEQQADPVIGIGIPAALLGSWAIGGLTGALAKRRTKEEQLTYEGSHLRRALSLLPGVDMYNVIQSGRYYGNEAQRRLLERENKKAKQSN